ncbi:uncharacterized protein LOC125151941 [Prionailurus viverrinus]|uniref:uncharacterized protein LOC125151941 n=1 Tax=Prionailurus viverrinus TaxID=61388 RepID=UPI001FF140BA|nr:uncharacterized protein LOC125151941 [Prionailurus viverrinus]XP_047689464.1 uncharacterized protein LOC125151941 [Prionailurus viverrinus]XP_047689466.1 uncharacterized protein LOC125151941 [Prionailurus viverrinus]
MNMWWHHWSLDTDPDLRLPLVNNSVTPGQGRSLALTQLPTYPRLLTTVPLTIRPPSEATGTFSTLPSEAPCSPPDRTLRAGVSDVVPTWLSRPEGWFGSKQGQSGARTQPAAPERRPHSLEPQDVDIRGPGRGEPFGERVMSERERMSMRGGEHDTEDPGCFPTFHLATLSWPAASHPHGQRQMAEQFQASQTGTHQTKKGICSHESLH